MTATKTRAIALMNDAIDAYVFENASESFDAMIEEDRSTFRYIVKLIEADDPHARKVAQSMDTFPREEIPHDTWMYIQEMK